MFQSQIHNTLIVELKCMNVVYELPLSSTPKQCGTVWCPETISYNHLHNLIQQFEVLIMRYALCYEYA